MMAFKSLCVRAYFLLAVLPHLNADIKVIPRDSQTEAKDGKYHTITSYFVIPEPYHSNDYLSVVDPKTKNGNDFPTSSDLLNKINRTNRGKIKYIYQMRPKAKYNNIKEHKDIHNYKNVFNINATNADVMVSKVVGDGDQGNMYNRLNKLTSDVKQVMSSVKETYDTTDNNIPDYFKVLPKKVDSTIIKHKVKENISDNVYVHDLSYMETHGQDTRTEVNPSELTPRISIRREQTEIKPINQVYIGNQPDKQNSLENMPINIQYRPVMEIIDTDGPNTVDDGTYSKKSTSTAQYKQVSEWDINELKLNGTNHVEQVYDILSLFFEEGHKIGSTENFKLFFKAICDAAGKNFEDFWELLIKHLDKQHGRGESLLELEKLYLILTAFTQLNRAAKLGHPIENTVNKIVDTLQPSLGSNVDALTITNILNKISNELYDNKDDRSGNPIDSTVQYDLGSIDNIEIDKQNLPSDEISKDAKILETPNKVRNENIVANETIQNLELEINPSIPTIASEYLEIAENSNSDTNVKVRKVYNLLKYNSTIYKPNNILEINYRTLEPDNTPNERNEIDAIVYNYKSKLSDVDISKLHKLYIPDLIKKYPTNGNLSESVHITQESTEMYDILGRNNLEIELQNSFKNESSVSPHMEGTYSFKINPSPKYKQNAITEEMKTESFIDSDGKGIENILLLHSKDIKRSTTEPEENTQIPEIWEISNVNKSDDNIMEADLSIRTDKNSASIPLMPGTVNTTDVIHFSELPNIEHKILQIDDMNFNPSINDTTRIAPFEFEHTTSINLALEAFYDTTNNNINAEIAESVYNLNLDENKESTQSVMDESTLSYITITNFNYVPYIELTTDTSVTEPLTTVTRKQADLIYSQKAFIEEMQQPDTNRSMLNTACIKVNNTQLEPICSEDYLKEPNENVIHPNQKIDQDNIKLDETIPVDFDIFKDIIKFKDPDSVPKVPDNTMEYQEPDDIEHQFPFNTVESDYFHYFLPVINKTASEKDTPYHFYTNDIHKVIENSDNALNGQIYFEKIDEPHTEVNYTFRIRETKKYQNEKPFAKQINFHALTLPENYSVNNNFISKNENIVEDVPSVLNNNKDSPPFSVKRVTFPNDAPQKPDNTEIGHQDTHSFGFFEKFNLINAPLSYENLVPNHRPEEEFSITLDGQEKSRNLNGYYKPWLQDNHIPHHLLENRPMGEFSKNTQENIEPSQFERNTAGKVPDNLIDEGYFMTPIGYENSRNVNNDGYDRPTIGYAIKHIPNHFLATHQAPLKPFKFPRFMKRKVKKLNKLLLQPNTISLTPDAMDDTNFLQKYVGIYKPVYIPIPFNHRSFPDEFTIGDDKDYELQMKTAHLIDRLKDLDVSDPDLTMDNVQNTFRALRPGASLETDDTEQLDGSVVREMLLKIVHVLNTSGVPNYTVANIVNELRNHLQPVLKKAYSCCNKPSSKLDDDFDNIINFINEYLKNAPETQH